MWILSFSAVALAIAGGSPPDASVPTGKDQLWTLARAINHAQRTNPQAREAEALVSQARSLLNQVNGTFWPRLRVEAQYGVTNLPAATFANLVNQKSIEDRGFMGFGAFDSLPTTDNLAVSGGLMLPVYAGGERFAQRKAARHGVTALGHRVEVVRRALSLEVVRVYFGIRRARALKEAAGAAVLAFERNLEVARSRRDAGSMLEQDVLNVEVRLSEARESVVVAENAARIGRYALKAILALTDDSIDIDAGPLPQLAEPDSSSPLPRPELAACRSQTNSADAAVDAAWAGYLPVIGAFGQVIYNQGFIEDDGNSISFVGGLSVGLNVGVDTHGAIEAARHARAAQAHRCAQLEQTLRLEADQARVRVEDARSRLQVATRQIELADKSAALTRDRFEEGLALSTRLIEAETALTAARVRRVEAETAEQVAIAELRQAFGLPILNDQPTNQTKDRDHEKN